MTSESSAPSSTGKPPPRWVLKIMTRMHVFLHRITGGGLNKLGKDEVCFVTMTGAKSGRTLTFPLMYVPHGDGVLLVASQGGAPKNPVWYHNLVKHAEALWPVCDRHYAPYAEYRTRTTRDIPIFVCEPA